MKPSATLLTKSPLSLPFKKTPSLLPSRTNSKPTPRRHLRVPQAQALRAAGDDVVVAVVAAAKSPLNPLLRKTPTCRQKHRPPTPGLPLPPRLRSLHQPLLASPKEPSSLRSVCPVLARARGSSVITSLLYPATFFACCSSTTLRSRDFKTLCSPISGLC